MIENFYKNKNVLITGHTGFKGSWMSYILYLLGANVTGIGLKPNTNPNLFTILELDSKIDSRICDIRNLSEMNKIFEQVKPEIVFHLAAQPLVIASYEQPAYTYEVNVMGTVNICECVRQHDYVKSFINVTTDKVYQNNEWSYGYREIDRLDGFDPYSNSKSCSELITASYKRSFFNQRLLPTSTCRAGNVIGGGDFNKDRIIPDCIKYTINKETIKVRNRNSIRPYQHVLEPIFFYLFLAEKQFFNFKIAGEYNIGPNDGDCVCTGDIVDCFCKFWKENSSWESQNTSGPHEANFLKLDCSKAKKILHWHPIWNIDKAVQLTVEWGKAYYHNENMLEITKKQIYSYLKEMDFK